MIAIGEYTISIVNDGQTGEQGTSVVKVVTEWTKSTSATSLPSNPNWSETKPSISAGEYLWSRERTDLNNNTSTYGNAHCDVTISGIVSDVDKINGQITDKVWQSDISTSINSYDSSTVSTIRDRVAKNETDIDGITSTVSDIKSTTDDLGTRMSTAETTIDQTANNVLIKATKSDTTAAQGGKHLIESLINVAPEGVSISADKVNIEGATIFSSGRLSQTSLNNAYAGKSTALSDSIPIYYRSPSSTTPTISTSITIGTSNNTDNSWTYVMPIPKRNSYFFICERQVHPDGSITFSTVRPLDSQTYTSKWVSSSDQTYIDGGSIYAHSITSSQLATDAIKSTNYQAAASGPYSAAGTFLDLSNGNFYTPNFGVQSLTGQAYLNGEIIATSGSIGDDSGNYWSIGNTTDSQGNGSASIVGNGTAYIQDGDWQIHSGLSNYSNGSINTQWYVQGQGLQLTYPYYDGYYYDYGMTSPVLDANSDRFYNQTVSQNFLYIRKHASTIPALESDWNYIFRIDKDGMIWINGQSLTQMIQSGVDGGAYLPTSGGTVNGNVTITGTLTATASKANQLTHTLSINGKGFDGSGDVNVGTLGIAYGGTGQTTAAGAINYLLQNGCTFGSAVPSDNDTYIASYADGKNGQAGSPGTNTFHRRPLSALWSYIKNKLSADHSNLDNLYVLKSGDTITGSLTVENGIYSDSAQLGDLIVTGAGRFANGLYGDLIGNADTATKAAKVADSGNGAETTFAYSKSGLTTASWIAAWNGYELRAISPANLLTTIGAVAKSGDTMTGTLTAPEFSLSGGINNTIAGFRLTNNGTNMDMGWTWTGAQGAGACFTSSSHPNQPGIFDFFARAKNSSNQEVTKHLVGNISGVLTWDDRRVVTATNSTAIGGTSTPIYIDANGYAQACTNISASSATKATQDADGNTISSTYLKLSGGTVTGITQFNKTIRDSNGQHYFGGAANRTQWYVITLAHNGVTPPSSNAQWYMCSMSIHLAGDYQNAPNGTIELSYYIYWDKTEFHAINVYATGYGPNINKVNIYYNLTNPFILYVDAANAYTTIWVDRVSYRDSAQSHNTKETKVQQSAAITVDDYNQIPIASIHTYNGTHLTTNSTFYPDVDNTHNLGTSDKKWSHVYATTFDGNLSGNASSASKLNSTRSFTIGKTAKNVDWSGAVSFSQAEISDNASTTAAGWMSKDDKVKLNGIEAGAQVNSITGVKGNSESSYRTGNVNITAANIGLGNLTNNKQVKGLSSGTTSGHFVTWGSDGYTVADSGITAGNVVKSVASNSSGQLVLTYADNTTSAPIDVEFVATQTSSVQKAEALNVNGAAVGGADQPVYFTNQGKPQTASKYAGGTAVTLNGTSKSATTASFYAPTGAGTSGQILQSSGGTPSWVNQSTLSVGSATTAGTFTSAASVTLTGDTTGTASSTKGWSITTKTDRLSTAGDNRAVATTPNNYKDKIIFQGLKSNGYIDSPSTSTYSYLVGLRGWADTSGGKAHELAFNDSGIFARMGSTTDWESWRKLIDSTNYTDYTVTKTGTGASGTWGIGISGNAASATKFNSNRSISLSGDVSGSATTDGSSGWSISTTVADDSHNHTVDTIVPKMTKSYTGVIASANDDAHCYLYCIKIVPETYNGQWDIKYRVYADMDGIADSNGNGKEESIVYISGMRNTYAAYRTWNNITNTSYRPYYYHNFRFVNEANISYGHICGISLRYAYNPDNTTYKRNVTFEILDSKNCTVSFFDSPSIYADVPSTGNYSGIVNFDATTQGNTMAGDRNDPNYEQREYWASRTAYKFCGRYQLLVTRPDGQVFPVNTTDNNITTTKTYDTSTEFDPFGQIFYHYTSGTTAANGIIGDNRLYNKIRMDLRYAFNVGGNNTDSLITARKPFYLVATPQSNGMAKIHSTGFSQTLPTSDDGLIYIYLGTVFEDAKPYRLNLTVNHPIYWYKDGAVRQFIQRAETANTANSATTAVSATKANYANNLLAYNSNETTIGANSSTAGSSTNNAIWFNYRDVQGGTITNDSTQIIDYYFGNRKGSVTGVKVHAANFVGDLTGNASTATSATKAAQDGSGNVITSTYVNLTGTQTISGAKTFSTMILSSAGICVNSGGSGTAGGVSLWQDKNVDQYGLALRTTANGGKHGFVQGDYATYNYMYASSDAASLTRGWVFKNNRVSKNVASIGAEGDAAFNGEVAIGTTGTDISGSVSLVMDHDLNCLNFIFN